MIEVVAIEGHEAEAGLLRLASDFATARLFTPKQAKKLRIVIEVGSAHPPQPISRDELMAKPGLFKSAHYHYRFVISLANGFEACALQMMHELIHASQIINGRYQIGTKRVKRDGEKQTLHTARWLNKKAGFIDDMMWQDRPWEQEAAKYGQQLATEFMAMIYGTQSAFEAEGAKKQLRLYEVSFALPNIEPAAPAMAPEVDFMAQPPSERAQTPSYDAPPAQDKPTYVQGIAEPRLLKQDALQAKRNELQSRGLLRN